jgi:hypothetical protein
MAQPSSFTNFVIFKGSVNSRRFRYAVPFDREFVEHVPILMADGDKWQWEQKTDLSVIGSNTRTVRMHINPSTSEGRKRAERFWQYVWESQKYQTTKRVLSKDCSCTGRRRG